MRAFSCDVCGQLLVFENSLCMSCGTEQGFDLDAGRLVPLPADGSRVRCANAAVAACNWLVRPGEGGGVPLCRSCELTRTRPADSDPDGLAAFVAAERAKRRLVHQLLDVALPVVPKRDDDAGLAFDLLSSAAEPVVTGHADGLITIDLAEGHDAHREAMRVQMGEPYRTMLGHLRHETGHYYWQVLVSGPVPGGGATPQPEVLGRFRELFGDERADYGEALQRHYSAGPPAEWVDTHVSAYATAHPWEDWAESFAHYLHIRDTLQTASSYGMVVTGPEPVGRPAGEPLRADLVALPLDGVPQGFDLVVDTWLPLTYALNAVNRSMGKEDLYPFVLAPPVVEKLRFVHELVEPHAGA